MTWVGDLLRAGIDSTGNTIKFAKPIQAPSAAVTGGLAVGGAATSAEVLPAIRKVQFTVGFADFDVAAESIVFDTGVVIPKGAVFMRTLVDNVVKFEGGSISVATLKIGDSDGSAGTTDDDRYMAASTLNMFVAADALDAGAASGTLFHSADTEIALTLALTGGNGDDMDAGSVTITVFYYLAADHSE